MFELTTTNEIVNLTLNMFQNV